MRNKFKLLMLTDTDTQQNLKVIKNSPLAIRDNAIKYNNELFLLIYCRVAP